jgi:DNA-binding protein YbaB
VTELEQAEQRQHAADRLAEVLGRMTGTAEHHTGLATATATATGELKSLRLNPAVLNQGPDAVGRIVVETARQATDIAVQRSFNELAKSLGDSIAMTIEDFAGAPPVRNAPPPIPQAPAAAPAPAWQVKQAPARRPRPPVDDDEDAYFADPFGGGSYR